VTKLNKVASTPKKRSAALDKQKLAAYCQILNGRFSALHRHFSDELVKLALRDASGGAQLFH
jgi:hypothetical protein